MSLGKKIREAREKLGMTQAQLAKSTGLTQATISGLESGRVKMGHSETLMPIARMLKLPVYHLLGGRRPQDPSFEQKYPQEAIMNVMPLYFALPADERERWLGIGSYLLQNYKEFRKKMVDFKQEPGSLIVSRHGSPKR